MRLLIVSSEFPPGPGGIGTHAYQLALGLSNRGHEILVVSPQESTNQKEIESFNKGQPFSIRSIRPWPTALLRAFHIVAVTFKALVSFHPDIVVTSSDRPSWYMYALRPFFHTPWVAIGHGTEFTVASSWRRRLTTNAFSKADQVITVSTYTRQRMEDAGVKTSNPSVIPNGANEQVFTLLNDETPLAFRKQLGISEESLVLLTVGRVNRRKGQDIVIACLPELKEHGLDVHYLIVGLEENWSELETLARQQGVYEHVHYLGVLSESDLNTAINACDLFVMTSRHTGQGSFEGFGIAVVEAALCGKPAVVSDNSGLPEAIQEGHTGTIVPEDNVDATAQTLLKLLQNKDQLTLWGKQARQRALEEQCWSTRIAQYDELLQPWAKTQVPT